MNKKEITEIKKQFTPADCSLTRICGCYVDADKNIVASWKDAFLSLPEEEMFKYFDLFRKSLSGGIGRNLINLEFPLDAEREGGAQYALSKLLACSLQEDALLDAFYEQVISSWDYGENYLILLVHGAYDVPGHSKGNEEMFDASDEVYSFINCIICPVSLAKPGLSYDAEQKLFHDRIRDWVVAAPMAGFLFPAFNDRSTDLHGALFYSKNPKDLYADFTNALLGTGPGLTAPVQKEVFVDLVEEALGESCDFETVVSLHNQLHELSEEQKNSPDPIVLDQGEIRNLLSLSGAKEETLSSFDAHFEHAAGENTEFAASNICAARKLEVSTPDVEIRISPDRSDLVEQRYIDGRPCLVIPITDEVRVNGIRVLSNTSAGKV